MLNKLIFPKPYKHEHPPVENTNTLFESRATKGQRAADRVVSVVGSWKFIIIQSCILLVWVVLNVTGYIFHWDPYPFILMNLGLSLQAAYTAPIIMMSQNRQAERDRLESHVDYQVNQKAEEEVRIILEHLDVQNIALDEILAAVIKNNNHNGDN